MRSKKTLAIVVAFAALGILAGITRAAQDKYTLRLPDGVAFPDFKGYEDWRLISTSKTDDRLKVILGNPTIIAAFKSGIPGERQAIPRGLQDCKDPVETEEEHGLTGSPRHPPPDLRVAELLSELPPAFVAAGHMAPKFLGGSMDPEFCQQ